MALAHMIYYLPFFLVVLLCAAYSRISTRIQTIGQTKQSMTLNDDVVCTAFTIFFLLLLLVLLLIHVLFHYTGVSAIFAPSAHYIYTLYWICLTSDRTSNTHINTNMANFTFLLSLQPLAGNDYLQIAQFFHTVLIRNVPQLNLDTKSQARRFITLIDTLYDNKVRVCLMNRFVRSSRETGISLLKLAI